MTNEPDWLEIARETGLAITHKAGIKEVDAGRDRALCLNEVGLRVLRRALERAYQQGVDRARDERRDGRDDASRLGAEPASPVANGEAPNPETQHISVTEQICLNKLKRENAEQRKALRQIADIDGYDPYDDFYGARMIAQDALNQSSEGE